MRRKISCIYKITNIINGKVYIGRTNNYYRRINEHRGHIKKDKCPLHDDMLAFGFDNFQFEIIIECLENELDAKEIEYIRYYREKLGVENVYNICKGGLGGLTHDIHGANNPMYHKPVSQERRNRVSKALKGRPKPIGFGAKISAFQKGRKKSPEHVAKKSHPIDIFDMDTGNVIHFKSKSEMERVLKCNTITIMSGKISHGRYKLANCDFPIAHLEGVETIENTSV